MLQPLSRTLAKTPAPAIAATIAPPLSVAWLPQANAMSVKQARSDSGAGHDLSQVPTLPQALSHGAAQPTIGDEGAERVYMVIGQADSPSETQADRAAASAVAILH